MNIFICQSFNHVKVTINNNIMEAIVFYAKLPYGEDTNIIGIYRPAIYNFETFNTNNENLLGDINLKQNNIIIGADFNICLFKNVIDMHDAMYASSV